ncbi:Glycosyltransferase involved in cell wall bisynthesis [Halpernia humi]|uniref:Glycosyltransferase involved in cell wall bisynthesis n=1 Tax=Halpernia humi TaxID=493375 RepID=A0A1H5ZPR7_9FLAO|nr:glycosyltransferase family 2 protein [Halpernia humi]SEG37657.1 Glycosyltransferase involved in cell wall bisynthesis [Halpernia humi]
MKFLIIIPTHNEEEFIFSCLDSLQNQSFQNFECVVVNDGSTDKTQEIVENFIVSNLKFKIQNLKLSAHEPGAKVVQTFYKGLNEIDLKDFDIICKFDADIIFPENYLEKINEVYVQNPKAGMVSGLVFIEKNNEWIFENLSSKNHVRGPIKSYRKKCFEDMNGLRAVLGWDNIDVMLAKMYDWETVTIKDLWVKHLRPTAFKYKKQKAQKLGEYFYNIGLSFPLMLISSAKSSFKNKSISEFFMIIKSFLNQKNEMILNKKEIQFIRKLRWQEIKNKF